MKLNDLDVIFLSYQEPNADENHAHLCYLLNKKIKRVHGVKGIDSAHKAAANLSTSSYFVLVDGDTIITDASFFNLNLDLEFKFEFKTLSFNSINSINGLIYGNGGLKVWNKSRALTMCSHENSDNSSQGVEFCFYDWYVQMPGCYSETVINSTQRQAFYAGFREGVKLTTDKGFKSDTISQYSLSKLKIWMSIGADVEYGVDAMMGARYGFYQSRFNRDFDINNVSNYGILEEHYQLYMNSNNEKQLVNDSIKHKYPDYLFNLDAMASEFFKSNMTKPTVIRTNPNLTDQETRNILS